MTLILFIFTSLIQAFVFMNFWKWFIVQTFEIKSLSFIESLGIICFLAFINLRKRRSTKRGEPYWFETMAERFGQKVAAIAVIFVLGYIIHLSY